jgi:hypothetical protein
MSLGEVKVIYLERRGRGPKIPSRHLPEEFEDNHENPQSGSRCSGLFGNFHAVQKIVTAHIGLGHTTCDLGLQRMLDPGSFLCPES